MSNPLGTSTQVSLIPALRSYRESTQEWNQLNEALESNVKLPIDHENVRQAFAGLNSKKFLLVEDIQFFLASATLLSRWTKDEKENAKHQGAKRPVEDIHRREISYEIEQLCIDRQRRQANRFGGFDMRLDKKEKVAYFQFPRLQFSYHNIEFKVNAEAFINSPANGKFAYWGKELQPAANLVFIYAREERVRAHANYWLAKMLNE